MQSLAVNQDGRWLKIRIMTNMRQEFVPSVDLLLETVDVDAIVTPNACNKPQLFAVVAAGAVFLRKGFV